LSTWKATRKSSKKTLSIAGSLGISDASSGGGVGSGGLPRSDKKN
jgi:hypothetical protein